jgi:Methyltransferase domain
MTIESIISDSLLIKPQSINSPGAWLGHIPFLSWILAAIKPHKYVELGTHTGNSYLAACQAVEENGLFTQCFAIDTWQGDEHAGEYGDEIYNTLAKYHDARYHGFSSLMRMTFDDGLSYFTDGSIDLLHIDGLHTYDAVKHDFDTWLPKLSECGVVLFHDISVHERGFGVWALWEELREIYPNIAFSHSYGLGVLFVGKNVPESLSELQSFWDSGGDTLIKRLFETLGNNISQQLEIAELRQAEHDSGVHLQNLNALIAERDRQLKERDCQLEALYNSTSWKVTRPLRTISHQLKRVRNAL